jgi:hypothetical protein
VTPTGRTLNELRRLGFTAEVVERWLPRANLRKDLFGCADVLAARSADRLLLLIQATSWPNVAARVAKSQRSAGLAAWLRSGGRFEVWGWAKRGERWEVRRVELRAEDLAAVAVNPRPRRSRRRAAAGLFDEVLANG